MSRYKERASDFVTEDRRWRDIGAVVLGVIIVGGMFIAVLNFLRRLHDRSCCFRRVKQFYYYALIVERRNRVVDKIKNDEDGRRK